MVDHHATIPSGMDDYGGQPVVKVRDPRFNDKLNLWELAAGKGSEASKESARLLIGYLSLLGVVSVYSPTAMLWTGVLLSFIPIYHGCVNEYTTPGIVGRVGDLAIKTGKRAGITLRDDGISFMGEQLCFIGRCSTATANLLTKHARCGLVSTIDAYQLYARILSDRALYVQADGNTCVVRTSRRRFIPRERTVCLENHERRVPPDRLTSPVREKTKIGVIAERIKEISLTLIGFKIVKGFKGCRRLGLLHKIVNDMPLNQDEILTLVHDIAIIRGEDINFAGYSFDGTLDVRFRKNHLQYMFYAYDWSDIDCYGGQFTKDGSAIRWG